MPTPSERRALLFLASLLLLGAAVRASAALGGGESPLGSERAHDPDALDRQLQAVDSVRQVAAEKKARSASATRARRAGGTVTHSSSGKITPTSRSTRAAPAPAIAAPSVVTPGAVPVLPEPGAPARIDVDRASAAELQRLPRVGPVLAARIVANRDSFGPFGSLEGLRRVKGVGPALAARIAPHVTFSLQPRPPHVVAPADRAASGTGRRSRRVGSRS